jgi:hypothetical protein
VTLVAVDLGNGHLDLAGANADSDDVSVLLGNGDGTFQPQARYGTGSFPESLVAADFNGDNRTDLAVANLDSNGISVLLGRGVSTLQDQLTNPVGDGPVGAVTADLSDGTFQSPILYQAGASPSSLVAGDFTGKGVRDLAVANSDSDDVSILLGDLQ